MVSEDTGRSSQPRLIFEEKQMYTNTHPEALNWYQTMLVMMFRALHQKEEYNYDFERFGYGNETTFDAQAHAHFFTIFSSNFAGYYESRTLLVDTVSKNLFDLLILFRLVGHTHLRLPLSNPEYWKARNSVKNFRIGQAEESGMFGPLSILAFKDEKHQPIKLKCWEGNVFSSFLLRQYYLERNGIKIRPEEGDVALDMGSCFGDTLIAFAASVGPSGFVHGFDFMPLHQKIIRDNIQFNPDFKSRVRLNEFAVGITDSLPGTTGFQNASINPGAVVDLNVVPVRSLDSMVRAGEIERVNFIKMDIEGYEMAALKGAIETIRTFRPKLAISLYHKLDDFIVIPQFINSLQLGYRFYLDHYTIFSEETVLYAEA